MNKFSVILISILAVSLLGQIRFFDEIVYPGQELEAYININNPVPYKLEDINIQIVSYDLGLIAERNPFDVLGSESTGKVVSMSIPKSAAPGEYILRISARAGNIWSVKHRFITVI